MGFSKGEAVRGGVDEVVAGGPEILVARSRIDPKRALVSRLARELRPALRACLLLHWDPPAHPQVQRLVQGLGLGRKSTLELGSADQLGAEFFEKGEGYCGGCSERWILYR